MMVSQPCFGRTLRHAPTPARADDASYSLFDECYEDAPLEDPARSCAPAALGAALRLLIEQRQRSLVCAAGGWSGGGVSTVAQRRGVRRAADQPRWQYAIGRGCEAAPGARGTARRDLERGVPVRIGPVARERESTIERTERWHGARDRGGD